MALSLNVKLDSVSTPHKVSWQSNFKFYSRLINDDLVASFMEDVKSNDWLEVVYGYGDCEAKFDTFFGMFRELFDKNFPIAERKPKLGQNQGRKVSDKSWYTPELARLRNMMLYLNDRYKTGHLDEQPRLLRLYSEVKRIYRNRVDLAKKIYNVHKIKMRLTRAELPGI